MNCPHCETELVEHVEENAKKGAQHCNGCGCCFLADGETPRPGVAVCEEVRVVVVEEATEEKPISRMNRAELIEMATKLGLSFAEDVTVAQLRDLLKGEGD